MRARSDTDPPTTAATSPTPPDPPKFQTRTFTLAVPVPRLRVALKWHTTSAVSGGQGSLQHPDAFSRWRRSDSNHDPRSQRRISPRIIRVPVARTWPDDDAGRYGTTVDVVRSIARARFLARSE